VLIRHRTNTSDGIDARASPWDNLRAAKLLQEKTVKLLIALALFAASAASANAADSACMAAAKEKKLAGAARASFVKKCESDAQAKCEIAATEKKLAGAAKTSSVKKCVRETGPAA
jgi:hypothetical protein